MVEVDARAAGSEHLDGALFALDRDRTADTQILDLLSPDQQGELPLAERLDCVGIPFAIGFFWRDVELVVGVRLRLLEMVLEALDQRAFSHSHDEWLVGLVLVELVVLLGDLAASGLDQVACVNDEQVVVDVDDGTIFH